MICLEGTAGENILDERMEGFLSRAPNIRSWFIAGEFLYAQQIKIISLRVVAVITVTEPDSMGAS
jgi:hypothetical protein